mmetsp:Transcript_35589/g.72804  ORF Transcript_35589/g.72804 Transcript_35589/m.72804 type:complete len:260 (-) Transcript_35589:202-981(-)
MKLATAVISLVTIIGANGTSTASTKSSKSKASCIESKSGKALSLSSKMFKSAKDLSLSSKMFKSAKDLSLSTKSEKASEICAPCSIGSGIILNTTLCGTDAGFCEFSESEASYEIVGCDANNCVPDCSYLEPICELCVAGPIYGVDCPQGLDACEISFSADAEPTCVIADCVPPDIELGCGVCSTAYETYGCPDDDVNYCQADFDIDAGEIVCKLCGETACPDYTFDQCSDPPGDETDARRLEMGDKEWSFNNDNVFQW